MTESARLLRERLQQKKQQQLQQQHSSSSISSSSSSSVAAVPTSSSDSQCPMGYEFSVYNLSSNRYRVLSRMHANCMYPSASTTWWGGRCRAKKKKVKTIPGNSQHSNQVQTHTRYYYCSYYYSIYPLAKCAAYSYDAIRIILSKGVLACTAVYCCRIQ